MTTLKQALANGKLDNFIQEHSMQEGNADQVESTLASMVGTLKTTQEASAQDDSES
jgi:hypothetical protein